MSDYFDRVERQLVRSVEAGVPRSERSLRSPRPPRFPVRLEHLGLVAAVLLVVVVMVVFVGFRGHRSTGAPPARGAGEIAFTALPIQSGAPLGPSIDRTIVIVRRRIDSVFPHVRVARAGDGLVLTGVTPREVAEVFALLAPGRLYFYDWEATALLASGADAGKTVASQLKADSPLALSISQGNATSPPGSPGDGSVGLYQAVELAHRQPSAPRNADQSHFGPLYYLFGAPGSAACRLAFRALGYTGPVLGGHCLLAGPQSSIESIREQLRVEFGAGVTLSDGELLTVPQGTVVLQATDPNSSTPVVLSSPRAQFYVLSDVAAITGSAIVRAQASKDQDGNPDVDLDFSSAGQREFASVTGHIAKRGSLVSRLGQTLDQHFAIELDGKLITVPSIDYQQYPDGVLGGNGADITGGFTRATARELATLLRFRPLPVTLVPR